MIKGLYAAGECACVSVHGANRLGGNSLLETLVFGKIAGEQAGTCAKNTPQDGSNDELFKRALTLEQDHIRHFLEGSGDEDASALREEMRSTMAEKVFLFRTRQQLDEAFEKVRELKKRFNHLRPVAGHRICNLDLIRALELEDMLTISEVIVASALGREESRGSHVRLDFPKRDDNRFLKHTLAHNTADRPRIEYSAVTITKFQPEERTY
jgi:succinate dehydrogenase/fumarate reductase flavoprotein subunit